MASADLVEIRPRTAGEILDDAWRLYLGDAPLFLTLSGCFTVPLAISLLMLLTLPKPANLPVQMVLPTVAALLAPLTGLGSAACQEAFRLRTEGKPAGLNTCLTAALRRGLDHAGARAILLCASLIGTVCLLLPGAALWVAGTCVSPALTTADTSLFEAFRTSFRETQRQPIKSMLVFLARVLFLVVTVLNLHLFVSALLWVAENLAGFDLAYLSLSLSPLNPVYDAVLFLLGWVVLFPYGEAVNYLLHVDGRARYEGLDLWYRVQRHFPGTARIRAGLIILAVVIGAVWTSTAHAADRLQLLGNARTEIATIRKEIEAANPYTGSERWAPRLRAIADQLDPGGNAKQGRYRWFRIAIEGFNYRNRDDALTVLTQLDDQLAALQESLSPPESGSAKNGATKNQPSTEEIKNLVPKDPGGDQDDSSQGNSTTGQDKNKPAKEPPVKRDDPGDDTPAGGGRRGSGILVPTPAGGLGSIGMPILIGLLVAIALFGLVFFFLDRKKNEPPKKESQVERKELSLSGILVRPDQHTFDGLLRKAEDLARKEKYLEAVRTLYLAVLALLHRANLIRYERTRTNGEYVQQLHSRTDIRNPFRNLTGLFEMKWYGDRSCQPADYDACRELVQNIRTEVNEE